MPNMCAVQTSATERTTYDDPIARASVATGRIGSFRVGRQTVFTSGGLLLKVSGNTVDKTSGCNCGDSRV